MNQHANNTELGDIAGPIALAKMEADEVRELLRTLFGAVMLADTIMQRDGIAPLRGLAYNDSETGIIRAAYRKGVAAGLKNKRGSAPQASALSVKGGE